MDMDSFWMLTLKLLEPSDTRNCFGTNQMYSQGLTEKQENLV